MPVGTFFGEDSFQGPKFIKLTATIRVTAGSQFIPVGLDFAPAGTIIPGMDIKGPGIPEGTVVIDVVNGVVQLSNAATESYISSVVTLTADENTGLGIGTMEIGSSFIVS
jgi:hypothetical protein